MPGRPMVVLQWAVTTIFDAAVMRSKLPMSLATAAAISAVSPREMRRMSEEVVSSFRIHSRSSDTVQFWISR